MENFFSQKNLGILFGVLILLGAGIYFYSVSEQKKVSEGKTALYQVESVLEEETKALPEAEKSPTSAIDVDQKLAKTVAKLNEVRNSKNFPKRAKFDASVKLGTLYLSHNQADKAMPVLKDAADQAPSGLLKASAEFLLGSSQEKANQFQDALKSYQEGLSQNTDGLKAELLLGMVRSSLKLNDKEKAKLYVEKMNKDVPGTSAVTEAQDLIRGM